MVQRELDKRNIVLRRSFPSYGPFSFVTGEVDQADASFEAGNLLRLAAILALRIFCIATAVKSTMEIWSLLALVSWFVITFLVTA